MPVRIINLFPGVLFLLMITAGCLPTSESAGISALSQSYSTTPSPGIPNPPILSEKTTPPGLPIRTAPAVQPTLNSSPISPVCQEQNGALSRGQIPSTYLKEPLEFRLYLPPCYSNSDSQSYPLLILLHGSIFTDDQWDRLGIDEAADRLITAGRIPPLIILMPFEEQTLTNPYQPGYGPALTTELLPYMEGEYPLCKERSCRAVGGISRGAAWAIHVGFADWKLFGSIGAHSLPPFWGDLNSLPLWLADIPKDERPRVFMDVGQSDPYRQPAAQFEQFLTDNNVAHEWYLYTGSHDEDYWSSHVEQYLLWYSETWQDQ
ncbi:MAG: alpha/beta hydrolase [Anaerolineaceae bacterium]